MDSGEGISVYAEAKGEYTKQLTLYVVPAFHRFFMGCLTQAQTDEQNPKRQLWKFQEILSQIPEWNVDKVQREISKILANIQCDYFDELITAVFIAHTKVLTAIRLTGRNKNRVQIVVPKVEHFLHRSLSECSRLLWSSAFLFQQDLPPIQKQQNHRQIEALLHEGIAQAIRGLLPVKNILKDCIADTEGGDEEEEDEKEENDEKEVKEVKEEKEETAPSAVPEETKVIAAAPIQSVQHVESVPESAAEVVSEPLDVESLLSASPAPAPAPAPSEPISIPAPVSTPTPAPVQTEVKAVEAPASAPVQAPQTIPTLVVHTEPSVQFSDFDQVIHTRNGQTDFQYVEKDRDQEEDDDELSFADDEESSLTDFEDLDGAPEAALDTEDFEVLG